MLYVAKDVVSDRQLGGREMRIDKPPRQSGLHVIGLFSTLKAGPIWYQSTIERDLIYFLEFDPHVVSYASHPFCIYCFIGTVEHSYTPDFQIMYTDHEELVECKPYDKREVEHTKQQVHIGQAWSFENEHTFAFVTDKDLREGCRLANLKLLWRYSRLDVPYKPTRKCLDYVAQHPLSSSLGEVSAHLAGVDGSMRYAPYLYHFLFRHILSADLSKPLTPKTLLCSA